MPSESIYGYTFRETKDIFMSGSHNNGAKIIPKTGNIGGIKAFFSKISFLTMMYNYFMIPKELPDIFEAYNKKRLDYSTMMLKFLIDKDSRDCFIGVCACLILGFYYNTIIAVVIFCFPIPFILIPLTLLKIICVTTLNAISNIMLVIGLIWVFIPVIILVLVVLLYIILIIVSCIIYFTIYVGGIIIINIYICLLYFNMAFILEILIYLGIAIKFLTFLLASLLFLLAFVVIIPFVLFYNIIYCGILFIFKTNVSTVPSPV